MSVTIETLKADPEVRKALRHGCDFAVDEEGGLDWFTIDGGGLHIGNAFRNVSGILAGNPRQMTPGELDRMGQMFQPGA